jgi:hypothetical protein
VPYFASVNSYDPVVAWASYVSNVMAVRDYTSDLSLERAASCTFIGASFSLEIIVVPGGVFVSMIDGYIFVYSTLLLVKMDGTYLVSHRYFESYRAITREVFCLTSDSQNVVDESTLGLSSWSVDWVSRLTDLEVLGVESMMYIDDALIALSSHDMGGDVGNEN